MIKLLESSEKWLFFHHSDRIVQKLLDELKITVVGHSAGAEGHCCARQQSKRCSRNGACVCESAARSNEKRRGPLTPLAAVLAHKLIRHLSPANYANEAFNSESHLGADFFCGRRRLSFVLIGGSLVKCARAVCMQR